MARGLDKESIPAVPPKRNPFKQAITDREKIRAKEQAEEALLIEEEAKARKVSEIRAIDREAEKRFEEIEAKARERRQRVEGRAMRWEGSPNEKEVRKQFDAEIAEIDKWEEGEKKQINKEREKAREKAEQEALHQQKIAEFKTRAAKKRLEVRELLEEAGVEDFGPDAPGSQALGRGGFFPEDYEIRIRATDGVLEKEGKAYVALVRLMRSEDEVEEVFNKFFSSKEKAEKAVEDSIKKSIKKEIGRVQKEEYSYKAQKAKERLAILNETRKERRQQEKEVKKRRKERREQDELKDFAQKKEKEYKEILEGLDLTGSTYTQDEEQDGFLTDASHVKNLRRERLGDYDLVTWNLVPHGQAGLVIFYQGEVYARTIFMDEEYYLKKDGTGAPLLGIPETPDRKYKNISPLEAHNGPLAALLPGLSKRRLLAHAKEHIRERSHEKLKRELSEG